MQFTYEIPHVMLGSVPCKRILNGLWQTAGGWGDADSSAAVAMMAKLAKEGFTSFDGADIYGPAEGLMGETRAALSRDAAGGAVPLDRLQTFTKFVPRPGAMSRGVVETAINRSLARMKTSSIDLVQFHWWDYAMEKEMLEALSHLHALQREGKIRAIGLTNFDTARLQLFVDKGLPIVCNQVQYSVIDTRPAMKMAPYAQQKGVHLLTYGTLCGGYLSEKYLGAPEPRGRPANPSLSKYLNMINAWGGWALFQQMLTTLKAVADRHGVSIANVATRWVLEQPAVGGVIIGLRAGLTEHAADNARVFSFELTAQDKAEIAAVQAKARDLMAAIGDCGDEYR